VIVCLCGSTKFKNAFLSAQLSESLRGKIVLSPSVFSQADGISLNADDVAVLAEVHRRKIDLADEVLVVDVDGYVGDATAGEIEYASTHGKKIRYWSAESDGVEGARDRDLAVDPVASVARVLSAQGVSLSSVPTLAVEPEVQELACALVEEESAELRSAIEANDLVGVADAIGDLLFVVYGTGLVFGVPIQEVFAEVCRSNLTKVGPNGEVPRRSDGKTMKGSWFEPPEIKRILECHGRTDLDTA
jgi:hypothetical protein